MLNMIMVSLGNKRSEANGKGKACGCCSLPEGGNIQSKMKDPCSQLDVIQLTFFSQYLVFFTHFHILYHDSVVLGTFISVSHFYYSIHSRFYYFALFSIWISVAQMIFFISVFHLSPYYLYFLMTYIYALFIFLLFDCSTSCGTINDKKVFLFFFFSAYQLTFRFYAHFYTQKQLTFYITVVYRIFIAHS